jgi:hypothetical protein
MKPSRFLRTCSRSAKQQSQERQVNELQTGVEPALMWVFRTNVTGDFGIVTEDFGLS